MNTQILTFEDLPFFKLKSLAPNGAVVPGLLIR